MPKTILFIIALTVIILTAIATIIFSNRPESTPKSEIDIAINQAGFLYRQRKEMGEDFSNGPCLTNALMPGWVVDITHSPRLAIDDLPQNQCPAYIEGKASHFVELDTEGSLIRAK